MENSVLKGLPELRAADWGFGVSVCIAVLCEHRQKIVCVTDNRASFGDFSAEKAALKNDPIGANWIALYAGNDVEHADPILRNSRAAGWKIVVDTLKRVSAEEIVAVVDDAYSEQFQAHIENKFLRKHKFDAESFLKSGKLKCTPEVYAKTWERIDREAFSLQFLVVGFGEKADEGQIWLVDGKSAPRSYNSIGFWAIGNGAPAAMSSLAFHVTRGDLNVYSSKEEATYFALAAKFMSESATDVGRSTFVVIESGDESRHHLEFVSDRGMDSIRKLWNRSGAPRVPKKGIESIVSKLIYKLDVGDVEARIDAMLGKPGFVRKLKEKAGKTANKNLEGKTLS